MLLERPTDWREGLLCAAFGPAVLLAVLLITAVARGGPPQAPLPPQAPALADAPAKSDAPYFVLQVRNGDKRAYVVLNDYYDRSRIYPTYTTREAAQEAADWLNRDGKEAAKPAAKEKAAPCCSGECTCGCQQTGECACAGGGRAREERPAFVTPAPVRRDHAPAPLLVDGGQWYRGSSDENSGYQFWGASPDAIRSPTRRDLYAPQPAPAWQYQQPQYQAPQPYWQYNPGVYQPATGGGFRGGRRGGGC